MVQDSKDSQSTASGFIHDDKVLPFHAELASARGRVVRLGPCIDDLLNKHDYPEAVSQLLGEALVLAIMLGSSLKFDGKLILQTKSDGPVDMIVAQYQTDGFIRGYARFDEEAFEKDPNGKTPSSEALLGHGHLAMTIDQGVEMERYQGIVAIENESLVSVAEKYFVQSEQLPSFIRIAVAKHFMAGDKNSDNNWSWRAGGLIVQDISQQGGIANGAEVDPDSWNRICHLASTLEDHELLDPTLAPNDLIFRLFHQENVRVFDDKPVHNKCSCTREHIARVLMQFSLEEKRDMVVDGEIVVTCEFCSAKFMFELDQVLNS